MSLSRRRPRPALAVCLAAALLLAACGSSSSGTSSGAKPAPSQPPAGAGAGAAAASGKVTIAAYKFAPPSFAVKRGGTITFTNSDPTPHTATADTGAAFDTGSLAQGQSKTVTFNTAGKFTYHCVFHAFMIGSVVVS